jgi:protein phosphatase
MPTPIAFETAELELLLSPSAAETGRVKPASTHVRAEFAALSHPGKVRATNEDHFLVSRMTRQHEILLTNMPAEYLPEQTGDDGYLFIVADGMGGMAAGEVASRLAISTSLKLFQRSEKWGFKINRRQVRELLSRINLFLREVDKTLTEQSEIDSRLLGMGTTLTAAYSVGIDLFIIHLGDSRVYLVRDGSLRQLTKDHTVAQAMADAGFIPHEDVRHHSKRNALTNFLGGHHGKVKADIGWLNLADGDRLLLCSDGLTEMVDDATITRTFNEHSAADDAAQALLQEALNRGGKDNITIVVARYAIPKVELPSQKTACGGDTTLEIGH